MNTYASAVTTHRLQHKSSVTRMSLNWDFNIATEEDRVQQGDEHIQTVWVSKIIIKKVKRQMSIPKQKNISFLETSQ